MEVISVHIWRLISLVVWFLFFFFSVSWCCSCVWRSTWGLTQQDKQIIKGGEPVIYSFSPRRSIIPDRVIQGASCVNYVSMLCMYSMY